MQQVREDFDRIALLTADEAEAPKPYSDYLLRQIPSDCDRLLEIGCGFGAFTRVLADRARHITAIDLSPQMIEVAKDRSGRYPNLEFILGDFLQLEIPDATYDCIVSIATLHHLPASEALKKMKSALRPGGVLIIHDLLDPDGLFDKALDFIRLPLSCAQQFLQTGRPRSARAVREAWAEHGKHDTYLRAKDVRAMRDEHLAGGNVHTHFLWRYTIVWHKPCQPQPT